MNQLNNYSQTHTQLHSTPTTEHLLWLKSLYPIDTIPVFSGDAVEASTNSDMAKDWLKTVENFLCTYPVPHYARPALLGSRLYGFAGYWWRELLRNSLSDWDEFRKAFIGYWCPKYHFEQSQLGHMSHLFHKIRQGGSESHSRFIRRRLEAQQKSNSASHLPQTYHVSLKRARKLIYDPDNQIYLCLVNQVCKSSDSVSLEALQLISRNDDILVASPPDLAKSPFQTNYGLCYHETEFVDYHIRRMVDGKIINPSRSVYGAPVLLIVSKDGEFRVCTDYGILNDRSINDRFWLPQPEEILSQIGGNKFFSKLRLFTGHYQSQTRKSACKTLSYSSEGHIESKVVPLDLREVRDNHVGLSEVLDYLSNNCSGYSYDDFDDLVICSPDKESHTRDVETALMALRRHHVYVNLMKSEFYRSSIDVMGHVVSGLNTSSPSPAKQKVVAEWTTPPTASDATAFLHLAGYYRRYIHDFAHIARPIASQCGGRDAAFEWTNECQGAFVTLKSALLKAEPLRLQTNDCPSATFRLTTEIHESAFSAVLEQMGGSGTFHVLDRKSARFHGIETHFSDYEKNIKAIVYALRKWRIGNNPFIIRVNHPMTRETLLNPSALNGSSLIRWLHFIKAHKFEIFDNSPRPEPDTKKRELASDGAKLGPLSTKRLCLRA